jgi:hypothetical protein
MNYNTYICQMKKEKQLMILGLFHEKRYRVECSQGKVISLIGRAEREMVPYLNQENGYLQYCLDLGHNTQSTVYGHHLVYLWAYGSYDPSFSIDHRDRDRTNNVLSNLTCGPHKDNMANRESSKGKKIISKPRKSEEQKQGMVRMYQDGASIAKIAKEYDCGRQNIYVILKNRIGKVSTDRGTITKDPYS